MNERWEQRASDGDLTILLPVLRRAHRIRPVWNSIRRSTPSAQVVFICDSGDDEVIAEVLNTTADFFCLDGNYASKINAGVELTQRPLLFFGADDLEFHADWLDYAKRKLSDKVGVVATNDQCNKRVMAGELATHPLVTREYAERETIDGKRGPLCERYPHEYVDREFSEVAQYRHAFAYAPKAIVEHLHPLVGKAPVDELYHKSYYRMRMGRRIYVHRRHMWTSQS